MDSDPRPTLDAHLQLGDQAIRMLEISRELFMKQRRELIAEVLALGQKVHKVEKQLTGQLAGDHPDADRIFVAMHFERIGDCLESFAKAVGRLMDDGIVMTDRANREIDTLLAKNIELLEAARDIIRSGSALLIRFVLTEGPAFEALANEYSAFHEQRLIQGLCQPKASSVYLAIVDYLRGVEQHTRAIVSKLASSPELAAAVSKALSHFTPV
ncbi:MAG: PhoU domain-containing protein [Bacteroidales bacterium]